MTRSIKLCLGLLILASVVARLWFVFEVSTIQPMADTGAAWHEALSFREWVCKSAPYCERNVYEVDYSTSFYDTASLVFLTRTGVTSVVFGTLITIFPTDPKTIYVFYILLDTLVILMTIDLMRRLGLSSWAIVAGVFLQATYIPLLIGSGTLLQQPFIRFALILAVWGYSRAMAAPRRAELWLLAGMFGALTLGFLNYTNRPLMWVFLIGGLAWSLWQGRRRLVGLQTAVILLLVATLASVIIGAEFGDYTMQIFLGVGDAKYAAVTTPVTYDYFWPVDVWWNQFNYGNSGSLFSDFQAQPKQFLFNLNYSLWANYQYPDILYFQKFLLNLAAQTRQHHIYLLLGLAGWIGYLARQSWRRELLLIGIAFAYVGLTAALISVEPRRVTAVIPFILMGAGAFFTMPEGRFRWWRSGLALACFGLVAGLAFIHPAARSERASRVSGTVEAVLPTPDETLWPWVVLDASPEDAQGATLSINGQVIKSAGEPMLAWRARIPAKQDYSWLFRAFSNTTVEYQTWLAYPVPRDLLTSDTTSVRIELDGVLYRRKVGQPSPWLDGYSLWRWQWNGHDPRIFAWPEDDSEPASVYLVGESFGPQNDILPPADRPLSRLGEGNYLVCPEGVRVSGIRDVMVCREQTGLRFYYQGEDYGLVSAELVASDSHVRINQLEIFTVLQGIYVANFYSETGDYLFSFAFAAIW